MSFIEPIRVLIVDDHPLFRQGLVDVISMDPEMRVLGEAADGDVAVALAMEHRPDVILMDVNLPNENGLQVTRRILGELPGARVIILTGYDDAEQVFHALRAGAVAYCTKDIPPETLLSTVRSVNDGQYVVQGQAMDYDEVVDWLEQRIGRHPDPAEELRPNETFAPLSPREMEILGLVTRGASNKEIAYQLEISQQTVKNHMTSILRKLQVDDRTQAAVYALRHGWVRLDSLST